MARTAPRVAWFSPLNFSGQDSSSVSAYISDLLLPILRRRFDIDLFSDSFRSYRDFSTFHFLSAFQRHKQQPYDVVFYQMEDHPLARFLRIQIGLLPGIVWFHDLHFRDRGPEPILNSPWRKLIQFYNSLEWDKPDAIWPKHEADEDLTDTLGQREAAWAALALFSEPFAQKEYNDRIFLRLGRGHFRAKQDNYYLPYPVDFAGLRDQHSRCDNPVVCYTGSPNIEHRAHKLLQAISELQRKYNLLWLVSEAEVAQAERMIAEFGISETQIISGRSPTKWRELVQQADLAVHTHYSMLGQPGVYLAISLAAGLPVIATRFRSSENFPEDLLFFVDSGVQEASQIAAILHHVNENVRRMDTDRIVEMAGELFDHNVIADEITLLFEKEATSCQQSLARWNGFLEQARQQLVMEARSCLCGDLNGSEELPYSKDYAVRNLLSPVYTELGWSK